MVPPFYMVTETFSEKFQENVSFLFLKELD